MKHFTALSLAATFFSAVTFTPALALDGDDFAQKLSATIGSNGMMAEIGAVSTDGDTVTITGLSIAPLGEEPLKTEKQIVFSGVKETSEGGYTAANALVEAFSVKVEDLEIQVGEVVIKDIRIPADPAADPMANITLYAHIHADAMKGTMDGKEVFSFESMEISNLLDAAGGVLTGTFSLEGLFVDLVSLGEEGDEQLAMAQAFGLEAIHARVTGENVWNIDTGALAINEGKVEIAEVGTLNVTGEVHGYDREMLDDLHKLQLKATANTDASSEELEALSAEILNLMGEKLSLSKMSVRFDDASFTGKMLAMVASQSGTTPQVMATGFAATLPVMAAQFGMPEVIQTMLMDAASTYLADPKNIEISVTPASAVPLMETMVVMFDPSSLVSLLNLSIKANQ